MTQYRRICILHGRTTRMCPKYSTKWTCFGHMSIEWTHQRGYVHSIAKIGYVMSLCKPFYKKMQRFISDFCWFFAEADQPDTTIRKNLVVLGFGKKVEEPHG